MISSSQSNHNWGILVFNKDGEILGEFDADVSTSPIYWDHKDTIVALKVSGCYIKSGKICGLEIFRDDKLFASRKYNGCFVKSGEDENSVLRIVLSDLITSQTTCTCGCCSTYGKYSTLHADWCDIKP